MSNYIYQIKEGTDKPNYRKSTVLDTKDSLEEELAKRGFNVKLTGNLKGGVDSQVYSANLDGKAIVVKHTEDRGESVYAPPFSQVDFFVPRENHNLDSYILAKLSESDIRVPSVIAHFPDITITLMEDLNTSGFTLMSDLILNGDLTLESAEKLAQQLIKLAKISQSWNNFECYKTPEAQIFERGMELRMVDPNKQKDYLYLEKEFLSNRTSWIWPDGHPKNMFVNKNSDVAFIDFGGSYWGDQRFILPNFLGQFIVLCALDSSMKKFAINYVEHLVNSYKKWFTDFDESITCKYTGMEILHRAFGKWITGVTKPEQKLKNIKIGLAIFDSNIERTEDLLYLLQKEL